MMGEYRIEVLEKKHAMKLLLILMDGDLMKGELASHVTVGTASVQARVADLVEAGLLTETSENVKPFRKMIGLTDKGREVAESIRHVEDLLLQ